MYLSGAAISFYTVYFAVYFVFFIIIVRKKLSQQILYITKIALAWYSIAGLIYLPLLVSTFYTYSWQILLSGYSIFFFVIGTTVCVSLIIAAFYKKNQSFLFSFAYLIPGIFSIIFIEFLSHNKSLSNLLIELIYSGTLTSIIYSLDCKFNFSRSHHRKIAILLYIVGAFLIAILTPMLAE